MLATIRGSHERRQLVLPRLSCNLTTNARVLLLLLSLGGEISYPHITDKIDLCCNGKSSKCGFPPFGPHVALPCLWPRFPCEALHSCSQISCAKGLCILCAHVDSSHMMDASIKCVCVRIRQFLLPELPTIHIAGSPRFLPGWSQYEIGRPPVLLLHALADAMCLSHCRSPAT